MEDYEGPPPVSGSSVDYSARPVSGSRSRLGGPGTRLSTIPQAAAEDEGGNSDEEGELGASAYGDCSFTFSADSLMGRQAAGKPVLSRYVLHPTS